MICNQCNREIENISKFCIHCGARVQMHEEDSSLNKAYYQDGNYEQDEKNSVGNYSGWGGWIGGIVVIGIILYNLGIFDFSSSVNLGSLSPGLSEYNRGVTMYERGEIALAKQQYELAIQMNPNLAEAYLNLGLIYLNDGWMDGAEDMTIRAIDLLSESKRSIVQGGTWQSAVSIGYNNLGAIEVNRALEAELRRQYRTALNHQNNAIKYFEKAISLDPMNSKAQGNLRMLR